MVEHSPKEISIAAARDRFARLVHEVERGQPVAVTRRGQPVAVLMSVEHYRRLHGGGSGIWEAIEAYRAEADFEDWPDGADPWDGVRDDSPGREVVL